MASAFIGPLSPYFKCSGMVAAEFCCGVGPKSNQSTVLKHQLAEPKKVSAHIVLEMQKASDELQKRSTSMILILYTFLDLSSRSSIENHGACVS